jgi:hypothetical protein
VLDTEITKGTTNSGLAIQKHCNDQSALPDLLFEEQELDEDGESDYLPYCFIFSYINSYKIHTIQKALFKGKESVNLQKLSIDTQIFDCLFRI